MAMIIALVARTRPLPAILSVYVLSSRAIAFRNLTQVPRVVQIACKDDDFTTPVERVTVPTWELLFI